MSDLNSSSIDTVSIENYEIQIFRSVFHVYLSYLCMISFLTTLDIYKDYFKSRHIQKQRLKALFSL